MSLLCWLPLNKDKQNYGCKLDYFFGQASFFNNGKIGKCLDGSSVLTTDESVIPNLISKTHICTISCWIKIASETSAGWVIRLGDTKGLKISPSLPQWNDDSFQNDLNLSINNNTWKHVALTLDGTYVRLYIDGEYIEQIAISDTTEIVDKTITIGGRNGICLNDIRVYDNCLSTVEIKEISKGLVLHWKLNDLIFAGSDSSGLRNNGIVNGVLIEENNQNRSRYTKSLKFNGSTMLSTEENQFTWFDFNSCTLSIWIYSSSNSFGNFGFIVKPSSIQIEPLTDFQYKSLNLTNYNNKLQVVYSNGTDYVLLDSGVNWTANQWHFCTFTLNNSLLKIYFDGEKIGDNFVVNWGTATNNSKIQFQVGYNLFDNTYFNGMCNDIRFYTTPLLDKDIKMLYNINMRIDNLGGIHSFELGESNKASITLTGTTTAFGLQEDGEGAHLSNKNSHPEWLSPNFIEY